jgi:hypothetical protein
VKLTLLRSFPEENCTIGDLFIDGQWFCHTLEDVVRADGVKIPGETAIPAGTYKVQITWSPRFSRELPLVVDVPGFYGIRIHPGNKATDTEGCILVGDGIGTDHASITDSRKAFDRLFPILAAAVAGGITMQVI